METGSYDGKLPQVMNEEHHKKLEIGRILRQARIEQGLTLEEVQEATRIRERYLDALERDDYEVLPAAVYVRGFLKTYADYLGLHGSELSEEVKRQQTPLLEDRRLYEEPPKEDDFDDFDDSNPGALTQIGLGGTLGRFIPALVGALVGVALLVGILYFIGRGSQTPQNEAKSPPPPAKHHEANPGAKADPNSKSKSPAGGKNPAKQPPPETTSTKSAKTAGEKTTASKQPPAPDHLEVAVSMKNSPSWLEIRADGNRVLAQVAYPGFSQTFQAKRKLSINAGNAGAVQVKVNGQSVGTLGDSGQVLTRTFTLKSQTSGG